MNATEKMMNDMGNIMNDIVKKYTEGEAKCRLCGQTMSKSNGCLCSHLIYKGKKIERIKYGEDEYDSDERCHDCLAKLGEYHHDGCDVERCPVCGDQLISCECDFEFEDVPGTEEQS